MTYASQSDLVERYGESAIVDLTDRGSPPAGAIDAGVVTRALEDADAMINGYLAGRYQLPIAATPPLLRDLAQAIAVYKLHRNVTSDKVRKDYEDAVRTLVQISRGDVRLDVAGVEPAASGASGVRTNEGERPLSNGSMKGFV